MLMSTDSLRRFHHYSEWEEVSSGMWKKVTAFDRAALLPQAVTFTGDAALYGLWMLRVIDEWPISCEQNLGFSGQNRQAWIGHAACCLAIKCPEDITREAWWLLTQTQRDAANAAADIAIRTWETRQQSLGQFSLFGGMNAEA